MKVPSVGSICVHSSDPTPSPDPTAQSHRGPSSTGASVAASTRMPLTEAVPVPVNRRSAVVTAVGGDPVKATSAQSEASGRPMKLPVHLLNTGESGTSGSV